jgi:hypothetical protein
MPERSALAPALRLESVARGFPVSIGICLERFKYHPMNGIGHNTFLARMRNWKGREAKITGVSMYEVWFEA